MFECHGATSAMLLTVRWLRLSPLNHQSFLQVEDLPSL